MSAPTPRALQLTLIASVSAILFGGACEAECDKQGRVLLPPNLRRHAGLEKDAVVVGVGNRVEIWDAQKWAEYNDANEESVNELAEQLASLGI